MRNIFKRLVILVTLITGIGPAAFAKPVDVCRGVKIDDTLTIGYLSYDNNFDWTSTIGYFETCDTEDNNFFFDLMCDLNMHFDKGVTYKVSFYYYDSNGKIIEQDILIFERLTDSWFNATWRCKWDIRRVK